MKENIDLIKNNIDLACNNSNRDRDEIFLLPVSKTVDVEKIQEAIELGFNTFGENKVQEILKKYDFIKIIGDNEEANYVGILSFVIDNISSDSMAPIFSQKNIIVRTGLHCAPLAHKFLDTFHSGTIRLSTSYFTNKKDFEELIMLLDYIETNI